MILITGASGHLGANLAWTLASQGAALRLLIRPGTDPACLEGLNADVVQGDLTDAGACRQALRGVRQVYHCAAQISTHYGVRNDIFRNNVIGTANLLRAAAEAGVERVVVTGSFSATGHRPDRPADETEPFNPLEPHLPYAFTKAATEHACLRAVVDGLDVVIAVSCALLGPRDFKPSRMGQVLTRFAHRRLLAYVPGGFEFVSARDIVQGHLLAMERGLRGHKYIFSTRFASLDELMELFAKVTGRPKPPLRIPAPIMHTAAQLAEPVMKALFPRTSQLLTPAAIRLLQMGRRADCSKAVQQLGYRPSDIESAVEDAYAWFVQRGVIAPLRRSYAVTHEGARP
jgi:nucleoside-diphosphate-sugar epimerase